MAKNYEARFYDAPHPMTYGITYGAITRFLELRGGLNVTGSDNLVRSGRVVNTANHDHGFDFLAAGIGLGRAIRVPGKKELKSWRYGFLPGIFMESLGGELFDRYGSAHEVLKRSLAALEDEVAVLTFIEETRKRSLEDFTPREGVAWLAIKATSETKGCPIVPIGLSTAEVIRGRPIQMVVGEKLYIPRGTSSLPPKEQKSLRKELTAEVGEKILDLRARAMELHANGAGTPGEVVWN